MHPMIVLGILFFAVVWGASRFKSSIKVPAMTEHRRRQVLRIRQFKDRYASLRAEESARLGGAYGPLSAEQIDTYLATRERLKKAA